MTSIKNVSLFGSLLLLSLFLTSCVTDNTSPQQEDAQLTGEQQPAESPEVKATPPAAPASLPVRFLSTSFAMIPYRFISRT